MSRQGHSSEVPAEAAGGWLGVVLQLLVLLGAVGMVVTQSFNGAGALLFRRGRWKTAVV